jgi:hypothetical protein
LNLAATIPTLIPFSDTSFPSNVLIFILLY